MKKNIRCFIILGEKGGDTTPAKAEMTNRERIEAFSGMRNRMEFSRLSSRQRLDNVPFNHGVFMGGPFTHAAAIAGRDNFGRWMPKRSEAVNRLIRLRVDYSLELARYWKETLRHGSAHDEPGRQ